MQNNDSQCIATQKDSVILKIRLSYRYYIEGKSHSRDTQKLTFGSIEIMLKYRH